MGRPNSEEKSCSDPGVKVSSRCPEGPEEIQRIKNRSLPWDLLEGLNQVKSLVAAVFFAQEEEDEYQMSEKGVH